MYRTTCSVLGLIVLVGMVVAQDGGNSLTNPGSPAGWTTEPASQSQSANEKKYYVWYKQNPGDGFVGDGPWTRREAVDVQNQYVAKGYYKAYVGLRNGTPVQ